jgi:acyl-CoA thioesterase-1
MLKGWSRAVATWLWLGTGLAACAGERRPAAADAATANNSDDRGTATVLLVGTSLTAGYGLDPGQAWPALVQAMVDSAGLPFTVVNAGVSGETSAGARRRIDWLLEQQQPRVVLIETGANDGLRGQSIDSLEANLVAILERLDRVRPRPVVIVAGMEALPNLGSRYINAFRSLYPRAARAHDAIYLPFLLDGVAGIARFNQADGIHPNAAGSVRIAENVWRVLGPVLDSIGGR